MIPKLGDQDFGRTIVVKDEFELVETPSTKEDRKESFVQAFDFDDDLEDLLDDQTEIPNNNFSDLKVYSVPNKVMKDAAPVISPPKQVNSVVQSPLKVSGSEKYIQAQVTKKKY